MSEDAVLRAVNAQLRAEGGAPAEIGPRPWVNCPACKYPGIGETDPRKKYMGIYRPGKPCDKCGFQEPTF